MKLTNKIYLNCGIYKNDDGKELLFIAIPSYFASSAWTTSDESYESITGRKFEGITSDDCNAWLLNRHSIRRITETDNLDELVNSSCDSFKEAFNQMFS